MSLDFLTRTSTSWGVRYTPHHGAADSVDRIERRVDERDARAALGRAQRLIADPDTHEHRRWAKVALERWEPHEEPGLWPAELVPDSRH